MAYKIIRNRNISTKNDSVIEGIEGNYETVHDIPQEIQNFIQVELPNGDFWLYDISEDDEAIENDIAGYNSLATIMRL